MDKKINVATVAKRMNRILAAYREQRAQETQTDGTPPVASTSSSSSSSSSSSPGETNCTAERKMELDKAILKYAAQIDNQSDSDVDFSDQSYSLAESSLKRRFQPSSRMATVDQQSKRRRQPTRTVKRAAVKLTSMASKRVQRKVTCTITSNASPDRQSSSNVSSDSPMSLIFPDSDDSDTDTVAKPIKSSIIIKTSKSTCIKPM